MGLRLRLLLDLYLGGLLHAFLKIPTILLGKVLKRNHELSKCEEIGILKLLGGGSLVIAYPALLALKRLPHVKKLTLITTPAIKPFGETLGIFDEIIVIREDSPIHLGLDSLKALKRLFRYDAIIDFEIHSRLTTVFSLLTCARNRIGFFTHISFWRRGISTHLVFCNTSNGIFDFYDQIAGIFATSPVAEHECWETFRSQLPAANSNPNEAHIAIASTCSGLSPERMLTADEWVAILTKKLAEYPVGAPVYLDLMGGPADVAILNKLKTRLDAEFGARVKVENFAGKTKLRESVRQLSGVREVLCIDSSLLHFSRLLGLKTTSYWGPTDPRVLARPRSNPALDEIHYVKLPCSPCVHVSHQPPCRGNNLCMRLAANPGLDVSHNPPWVLH